MLYLNSVTLSYRSCTILTRTENLTCQVPDCDNVNDLPVQHVALTVIYTNMKPKGLEIKRTLIKVAVHVKGHQGQQSSHR